MDTFKGIKLIPREVKKGQRREVLESGNRVGRGELVVGEDQLVEVDTVRDIFDMVDILLGHVEVLELLEIDSCGLGRDNGGRQLHPVLISVLCGEGVFGSAKKLKKKEKKRKGCA